jgi:hypothetical protein
MVQSKGQWTEDKVNSVYQGLQGLPAGATDADYKNFAGRHGMQMSDVKALHQDLVANKGGDQAQIDKIMAATIRRTDAPVESRVAGVQMQDSTINGTTGVRKSRSEVAATEIAKNLNIAELRSRGAEYLQSLGFTKTQADRIASDYKKATGQDLKMATEHKDTNTENKTTSTSIEAGVKVPDFIPVSAGMKISGAKSTATQKLVDKAVQASTGESESQTNTHELARIMARTASEAKSAKLTESLSHNLSLSESAKSAISDTSEKSVAAGATENLATAAVNELMQEKFVSGDRQKDAVDAMAYLSSDEGKTYLADYSQRFADTHHVGQAVNTSVAAAQVATKVVEKHEEGIDPKDVARLEGKGEIVKQAAAAANARGPEGFTPTPGGIISSGGGGLGFGGGGGRGRGDGVLSGLMPAGAGAPSAPASPNRDAVTPLGPRITALNQINGTTSAGFTALPGLSGPSMGAGTLGAAVRAPGANMMSDTVPAVGGKAKETTNYTKG